MRYQNQRSFLALQPSTKGECGVGVKLDKAISEGADSTPDDGSCALVLVGARAAVQYGWFKLSTTMVSSLQTRSHVRLSCRHTVRKRECAERTA